VEQGCIDVESLSGSKEFLFAYQAMARKIAMTLEFFVEMYCF